MAPDETYRPPLFSTSRRPPKAGPDTLSTTTSTDRSPTAATMSSSRSMTRSAPMARTCSVFARPETAVAAAPRRLASCTTAEPTPPEAPVTTTCSSPVTPRAVQHILGRPVGTRDRAQLRVAQVALHREDLRGRHFHELREGAVEIGKRPVG